MTTINGRQTTEKLTTVRRENSEWKTKGEYKQMDIKQGDEDRQMDKQTEIGE